MQLKDFHVIVVNNPDTDHSYRQVICTDDIHQTVEEEYSDSDITILNESEYSTADFCTIVDSLLEDVNAHKYCNKIYDIIDTMKRVNISELHILQFAREYTKHMFELYGY